MRRLRVGIIDLITKGPSRTIFGRLMNANFASIMPQAVGVWCEHEGHHVTYVTYTGFENLVGELPGNMDIVFIGAFTESAFTAYALSRLLQSRGAVTVLGGPHSRCYPQDATRYFDYVLGFTDRSLIQDILMDFRPHRPIGVHLSSVRQPSSLPGVRERWKFIEPTVRKTPLIKLVPMLGSIGCPYTCSFCIDSVVPYHAFDVEGLKEDLSFLLTKFNRPRVGWHDPNFGVRFDETMNAIEEAVPSGSIDFIAESSLSILTEPHVQRMKKNGFKALLPGIESWYSLGDKSRTGRLTGMDKVLQVSEQINMILRSIPYLQANLVLGLDADAGSEPFELTKKFIDLTPGAFPGYSMLSAFGQAAPLNLELQRAGRVLPLPFHFLDSRMMNIVPRNYAWAELYDHVIDLEKHTFSVRAIGRRFRANYGMVPRWLNVVRAVSAEGSGRIAFHTTVRRNLETDRHIRDYFEQETTELPRLYEEQIRKDLGALATWLPTKAFDHDPLAYARSVGPGKDTVAGAEESTVLRVDQSMSVRQPVYAAK